MTTPVVLILRAVLLCNGKKKRKDLRYLSSLHSTLTVTLGEFRSSKEPREGARVSVRLFIPSSLHLSPLSTHAIDGMFTTPSEIDINSSERI